MKKFKLYVNESKKDDELLFYKNYVFTEGMIVLDDGFYYSWKYFTNFSEDGEMTIKTKKGNVVFQFIQGVPVISVPVKSFMKAGNIIIDDTGEFFMSKEFKNLEKYIDLDRKKMLRLKG